MADAIAATALLPGARRVERFRAMTVRYFAGDTAAPGALRALAPDWSGKPGELVGSDPWLAWRSPQETIAVGLAAAPLQRLLVSLAPGRSETAYAADLSDALAVFELHGPRLDAWLAHLVDATAIAHAAGRATRCRLADVAVMLLRLAPERLWLIADRPLAPYLANWLAYTHEGAFSLATDRFA